MIFSRWFISLIRTFGCGLFCSAVSLFCASGASAVDYYWTGAPSYPSAVSSSPQSVIDMIVASYSSAFVHTPNGACYFYSESNYRCPYIRRRNNETPVPIEYIAYRKGDACPSGTEYDSATGECKPPEEDPCASTEGQVITHEYNGGPVDRQGPPDLPPSVICQGQCQYALTNVVKGCSRFLDGDNLTDVFCTVEYKGNGQSCTSGNPAPGSVFDQPPSKPPTKADPTYKDDTSCGDWVTQPDGSQKRSCGSTKESKQPGNVDCSGSACKAGSPPPDYTKTDVKEDTSKTTNPDGSSTTTTNTTTDTTNCKGVKPCTSTSKTETTTSGKDADGEPGDSSYECAGPGCDKDSEKEESEETPERQADAGNCDAAFSCSGDAIDCEILRKQKEQLCLAQDMTDFDKHKSEIESAVTGDKFNLDEGNGVINVPSFVNQGTRFLPSTCPSAEHFSLTTAGGRSFELSYEPLCRAASDLSGLFVAVATVLAALYVGRSVGGN